jgi:GGDEF domain-containing protein
VEYAGRVRTAFRASDFDVDGTQEKMTISLGVAVWPDHGSTLDETLQAACDAEHAAKNAGGDTVRVAGVSSENSTLL